MSLPSWRGHIISQKTNLDLSEMGPPQDELAELARSYNQSKKTTWTCQGWVPPKMSLPSWRGHLINQENQLGPLRDGSPPKMSLPSWRGHITNQKKQLGPVRDAPPRWACRAGEVILSIKKTSLDLSGMGPPPRWACRAGEVILSIKKTSLDLSGMGPPQDELAELARSSCQSRKPARS